MLKKNKKNLLLAGGLLGAIITSSVAGIALSSCTTASSTDTPSESDTEYTTAIDWTNTTLLDSLVKDNQGVYYSDDTKTNVIAISPESNSTTIVLPDTVTTISGYNKVTKGDDGNSVYTQTGAFQGNTSIASITIQSGAKLTTIDKLAFSGCTALTNLTNTSGVLKIGSSAFNGCTSLKAFSLTKVKTIGSNAFNGCTAFDGSVDLASVYTIGDSAFSTTNITTVNAANNVYLTTIGGNAFKDCKLLTTVTIPSENISRLKTVGGSAFYGCVKLDTFGPTGTAKGSLVTTTSMGVVGANAFQDTIITTVDASKFTVTQTKYSGDNKTLYGTGSSGSFKNMHYVTKFILPEGIQRLPSENDASNGGYFSGVGDQGTGFDLVLPSSIVDFFVWTSYGTPKSAPFVNSGVKTIDASKISGYDISNANKMTIGTFYGASKLESIILKPGTTNIAEYAFSGCSSLKWVKNPTSETDTSAPSTNGFSTDSVITSVGKGAFNNAFSAEANATVDLSSMTVTTAPAAFSGSKVKTLKLPSTITTIAASSFDNMTNLSEVNFDELTKLESIAGGNFNNTQLTTIDLSNITASLAFSGVSNSAKLFTSLPTDCVVSLPNTMTTFSNVFMDTNNSPVTFNFPKGFPTTGGFANISESGVLTFTSGSQQASNLKNVDLTPNTTITSVGANTFFGSTKLERLTLSGKSITSSTPIFTASNISTANTDKTKNPTTYATANLPFGNNAAFTLNYANFTTASTTTSNSAKALFETTNADTWNAVAKIINSLSNYSYANNDATTDSASKIPANLSTWAADTGSNASSTSKVLDDSTANWTTSSVVFNNCFSTSANSSLGVITLGSSMASNTFIHNGITWTYTNNGTAITLTGQANMYKATSGNTSYLTFFNTQEVQAQPSTSNSVTYIIPNQEKVTVNLVIATKSAA